MATDFLGNELSVGDDVVFVNYRGTSADLERGTITKIFPHQVDVGIKRRAEYKIVKLPTVLAEPVKHGHWVWGSDWYPPKCSVCNLAPPTPGYVGDANFYERYFEYCPHCGAKMDEVSE